MQVNKDVMLTARCEKCQGAMCASLTSALHDSKQLDILVHCLGDCKRTLNAFVEIAGMVEVD